ncbi:HAD family phosphatase [Canibacter sp. lx-45]|uniref:HAD family hydrolase n=1 Tax=Canibacter zhuwentaonis TaxID=2837491 RepID=UPI001BDBF4EB|nr:HAD family phosphatase [Canibacter zhuwentaonis]MBT1035030.1 HAD family phosphatase [Canibacter zhuwentaonis]
MSHPTKPAALLWDMDGTIIDSHSIWNTAADEILARYDARLTEASRRQLVGATLLEGAKIFQAHGVALPTEQIIADQTGRVSEICARGEFPWRPGARELLAQAVAAGIPNVLVTMAFRNVVSNVRKLLPLNTFTEIICGDDVTHGKPHPEAYLAGAAKIGVSITSCVAFEDSLPGIHSATAAGAVTIGVKYLADITAAGAHLVLPSLQDFTLERVITTFADTRANNSPRRQGKHTL